MISGTIESKLVPSAMALRAIICGYSSRIKAQKLLVMATAFIDDSTTTSGDPRLFLGGFVMTADKWEKFSDDWDAELRRRPALAYFKMSEANALRGEFYGWTTKNRNKRVKRFVHIIKRFEPLIIYSTINCADLETLVKPHAPYGFADPYFYCFQRLIVPLATMQVAQQSRVPIDFVFDNQEGQGERAKFFYKRIRDQQPEEVKKLLSVDPIFRDDKDVLPLQAADLLVWHLQRRVSPSSKNQFSVPDYLHFPGYELVGKWDRDSLQRIADGFKKIPNLHKVKTKSAFKKVYRLMQDFMPDGPTTTGDPSPEPSD